MKNTKEVMGVASEPTVAEQSDRKAEETREFIKKKLLGWLFGVGVSLVPLLTIPVVRLVDGAGVRTMIYTLFCDISIMFVGISFTITALNDFLESYVRKKKLGGLAANCLLLLLGTVIYTAVVVAKELKGSIDLNVVFWLNLIYFVVMFLLALSKYIREIVEVR